MYKDLRFGFVIPQNWWVGLLALGWSTFRRSYNKVHELLGEDANSPVRGQNILS